MHNSTLCAPVVFVDELKQQIKALTEIYYWCIKNNVEFEITKKVYLTLKEKKQEHEEMTLIERILTEPALKQFKVLSK